MFRTGTHYRIYPYLEESKINQFTINILDREITLTSMLLNLKLELQNTRAVNYRITNQPTLKNRSQSLQYKLKNYLLQSLA